MGTCKYQIPDSKEIVVCAAVKDLLKWQHSHRIDFCKACITATPIEIDRPSSIIVKSLVSAAASVFIVQPQEWRDRELPDLKNDLDRIFDLFAAQTTYQNVIEVLESSVINGLAPEKAVELLMRYEDKQALVAG